MRRSRVLSVLVVVLGLAALHSPARADRRETARSHYLAGSKAFEAKDYAVAYEELSKAYEIAPVPELLYNLGRCLEALDRPDEALATYERFLAAHPDTETQERIAKLKAVIEARGPLPPKPEPKVEPTPAPPPAVIVEAPAPVVVRRPIYKRWWLWTTVGAVVVVGVGVGLGVGLTRGPSEGAFPPVSAR